MYAIEIRGLTKKYKSLIAVNDVSLTVKNGEIVSLLGVNGAGKTTMIKMLSCLSKPTEGDALLLGQSIRENPDAVKGFIGISPQETAVATGLSVRENLELMCGVHGFSKVKIREKTEELREALALSEVFDKRAAKLSGGWQRRLSLAMALIGEPKILFLDEPTLGLDVLARASLWRAISALKGKVTIVLTTHYMEEAEELSDRIAVMKQGQLIAFDTLRGLKELTGKEKLADAFVALVGGEPV